jgi:simple sugar transport system permease protein
MTVPANDNVVAGSQSGGLPTRWKFEQRVGTSHWWQVASIALALVAAFAVSSSLIASAGANVLEALQAMGRGAFGSWSAAAETLVQATPLVLTGLAVTVAFRGRIWNIGAEGQFWAGAMAAYWVAANVTGLPTAVIIIVTVITAFAAGMAWGGLAGFLKARYGASEIIVTVMLNFVILFTLSFLLSDAWQDPSSHFYQTTLTPEASFFPRLLLKGRLHLGFALALLAAVLVYVLLWMTTLGYEIRALGINPVAARYKGINVAATTILILAISGGIAALAGAGELAGLHHRLRLDISTGYGFTGIIIAMLGRLHPAGVILAAVFFGALVNGALGMQITTGVPVALVQAIQGITLLFLLTADVLARYRLTRVSTDG